MTNSNKIIKFFLSIMCAISFSVVTLSTQNLFAEDDEFLETDFDMQEPTIVEEPIVDSGAPTSVPPLEEPMPMTPPPAAPIAKEKKEKKKKPALVQKAAKKKAKVSKALKNAKKDKKTAKSKAKAKADKKNKKKVKKS